MAGDRHRLDRPDGAGVLLRRSGADGGPGPHETGRNAWPVGASRRARRAGDRLSGPPRPKPCLRKQHPGRQPASGACRQYGPHHPGQSSCRAVDRLYAGATLTPVTPQTAVTPVQLHAQLEADRAAGLAWSDGNYEADISSVAAAIFDATDAPMAAINVSGHATDFAGAARRAQIGTSMKSAATEISQRLGWRGDRETCQTSEAHRAAARRSWRGKRLWTSDSAIASRSSPAAVRASGSRPPSSSGRGRAGRDLRARRGEIGERQGTAQRRQTGIRAGATCDVLDTDAVQLLRERSGRGAAAARSAGQQCRPGPGFHI